MILHLDDWTKYPTAIVDTKTKNLTFLRQCEVYRQMGIKNYLFPLALVQPHLQGIDPYDPNLDLQTALDIRLECKLNPWYYFREIARVPSQGSGTPGSLRANRGNIALWWSFFNHQDLCLIQPRQTGKSLSTDELMIYLLTQCLTDSKIFLLTKDDALRQANVERLKEIRDLLPGYLNPTTKKDKDNGEEITVTALGNNYVTAVPRSSPSAALNTGRGHTCTIYHTDEPPFIPHISIALPAMLAGGNAAREEAAANGAPYGNIFTTTAGKKDDKSGRYIYDMLQGGMIWTEHLLDAGSTEALLETVRRNSPGLKSIINATFSHRQLGYTDSWLMDKISNSGASGADADRDFFNIWTSGQEDSPLSVEVNNAFRESVKDPTWVQLFKNQYSINWYLTKDELDQRLARGDKWVMGSDTSEAIGRDSTTFYITDSVTLETIGTAAVNESNLIRLSEWVLELMVTFKNIIFVPERKSSGQTIIDNLLLRLPTYGEDPFRRIYNLLVDEGKHRDPEWRAMMLNTKSRPDSYYDSVKRYFGFATAGSGYHSRSSLYTNTLVQAANFTCSIMKDKATVDEITGLIRKNGRIDHSTSGHDDRVIAWLLACWFLMTTRNLDWYGITTPLAGAVDFKTRVRRLEGMDDDQFQYELDKRKQVKKEIETLLERIRTCKDDLITAQYEAKLRMLDNRYGDELGDVLSISDLIATAKEERSKMSRAHRQPARLEHRNQGYGNSNRYGRYGNNYLGSGNYMN